MQNILDNYCSNDKGLLLFNPPTGTGKTHSVLQWIYKNYKDFDRKIFFVTNLKKNLPYKELEKLFEADNKQEDFKKDVLFINSNIEFVLENFLDVEDEIGDYFRDQNFHILKKRISTVNKFDKNPYHKEIVDATKEEIRKTLEPKFREKITRFLKENFPNKKERLYQIKTNKELQWIGKLYISVFTSKAKIYFLSIDKFFSKNSTLVEPSYHFIENDITKKAIVFIDEFDATKERILYKIIEQATNQKIDYIDLFNKINWSLNNNELPSKILTNSKKRQKEIDKGNKYIQDIIEYENILKERAKAIVKEYNIQYSFKTQKKLINNSRNLLFQDYKYHSVYKNGKYIKLRTDKNDRVNYLSFEEIKPDKKELNIVTLFNQIKGFLATFQRVVKELAKNYTELVNEQRSENEVEYTYDLALSTILEEYRLENKYKNFINDSILSHRSKNIKEQINYDLTVYEKGFRYYDFVDDEQHDTITKIFLFNFENTPEKFLLKLAEKSFVVGISATANIETVTGNYDLEYIKRQLGDAFFELSFEEKNKLKSIFDARNQNYKEIKINTEWVGTNNIKDDFVKLFEDKELATDFLNKLPDDIDKPIKDQYNNIRIFRISKAFKEFLVHEDIKGFLCLLTKKPKNNDHDLSLELLNNIFNSLIEDVTKTQDQFEKKDNKYDAYTVVDSLEFDETKMAFQNQLEDGKKVFVISMYQTLGAGQNLQYKAPNLDKLIDVSNGTVKWNKENKTDFNAIYLDKPTHLIQIINNKLKEEGFNKYMFQLEFLLEAGYISSKEFYKELKNSFEYLLSNKKKGNFVNRDFIFNNKNYKLHISKFIIQAIGRICRTNLKAPNIYIYADDRIEEYISDFDIEDNLVLNEFAKLVKHANSNKDFIDDKTKLLLNKAISRNQKVNNEIKKFVKRNFEWKWTKKQMNEWKLLRELCLKHPVLTDEEAKKYSNIIDLYIELPKENNVLYYNQTNDYDEIDINFYKELKYSVSQESARLNEIIHIPYVKSFFEEKNYALEFKKGKYIIPPQLFNNVYKGAIGETIGRIIFEKHLNIELEEIEDENYFELFDYKVKDKNIFIDFKHWKESTQIEENKEEILQKLERVNGSKVLIINILSKGQYKAFNTIDKKIIQIPGLWDIENKKFIDENIIKIIDEIDD